MQAQRALAGEQIEMVVRARGRQGWRKVQAARHAQVQQQQALVKVQQQVLAAPAHTAHGAVRQRRHRVAQGPAQRLAQAGLQHPGTRNTGGKAQAGHFDFG